MSQKEINLCWTKTTRHRLTSPQPAISMHQLIHLLPTDLHGEMGTAAT